MVQGEGSRLLEMGPGLSQQHPHGSANHLNNPRACRSKTEADRYQSQVPSCTAGRAGPEELFISLVVLRRVTSLRGLVKDGGHSADSSDTVRRELGCWFAL